MENINTGERPMCNFCDDAILSVKHIVQCAQLAECRQRYLGETVTVEGVFWGEMLA